MAVNDKVAWDVAPPIAGSSDAGNDGTFRMATSGASVRRKIPKGWKGRFVDVTAYTTDCDVNFGGSTVTCTYGQLSTNTGEVINFNAASGGRVPTTRDRSWRIPANKAVTHFAFAASGAGEIEIRPSSNRHKDGFEAEPPA